MKLYLVRHAKSKKNAGQKSGVNSELHGDGIEQAKRLGKYFHNVKLDKVYCSTMKRAKATLQAIKPYIENVPFSYSDKIKEHNNMVNSVKKGDHVVTGGGLIGTVTNVSDNEVDIDFGNNVKIKSVKSTLADVRSKDK